MTMRIAASFPACASVLVALLALGAAPARSADSANAYSAFERGDYSTALSEFRARARKGDPYSQYNVAVFYADDGLGVAKNYEESVKWYRKAAGQGHAEAQFRLSLMYIYGYGVDANRTLARHWLQRAAEQGHRDAQHNLGFMYRAGRGVDRDDAKAAHWYRQARGRAQGFDAGAEMAGTRRRQRPRTGAERPHVSAPGRQVSGLDRRRDLVLGERRQDRPVTAAVPGCLAPDAMACFAAFRAAVAQW